MARNALAYLKISFIFKEMRLKKKSTWNKSHPFSQMQKTGGGKYKKDKADSAKYFWRSDVVTVRTWHQRTVMEEWRTHVSTLPGFMSNAWIKTPLVSFIGRLMIFCNFSKIQEGYWRRQYPYVRQKLFWMDSTGPHSCT